MKHGILEEGRNCWRILPASRVTFLIDGEEYFSVLTAALQRANRSVFILGWDIDSRATLKNSQTEQTPLWELLNEIARSRPELNIYLLGWDYSFIYTLERDLFSTLNLGWRTEPNVHFFLDSKHPVGASHHQKIVVIDNAMAFAGGFDIAVNRWDTQEHSPFNPQRVSPEGKVYPPVHDVQIALDGQAAAALGELARWRWERATGRAAEAHAPIFDPWPVRLKPDLQNVLAGISRTLPHYNGEEEVREVENLYIDTIANAKKFIYIENQYVTSDAVGKAIVESLKNKQGPEIILVVHREHSGLLEENTMGASRAALLQTLRSADHYGRLGVYYPYVKGCENACINVHAKVMIVDDELVRIGSSNLSNRSLGLDTECDIAIDAAGDETVRNGITNFRNKLFAEHLGCRVEEVARLFHRKGSLIELIEKYANPSRNLRKLEDAGPLWLYEYLPESIFDPPAPLAPLRLLRRWVADSKFRKVAIVTAGVLMTLFTFTWWSRRNG